MRSDLGFSFYFDGDTPAREFASFEWQGEAHESISRMFLPRSVALLLGGSASSPHALPTASTVPLRNSRRAHPVSRPTGTLYSVPVEGQGSLALGSVGSAYLPTFPPSILSQYEVEVDPLVQYSGSIEASIDYLDSFRGDLQAFITWRDDNGVIISTSRGPLFRYFFSSNRHLGTFSPFRRSTITALSPSNAAWGSLGVELFSVEGETLPAHTALLVDNLILVSGNQLPDYFDGETPDDAAFTYEWEGEPDLSPSIRTGEPLPVGAEPIVDPNCPPPPPAPLPPQLALGCASPIDEWRRVWYVIPPEEVYEWGSVLLNFTLNSGAENVEEMRITLWPNPSGDDPFDFDDSVNYTGRWHVSYMPADSTMVINGTTRTVTTTPPDGVPRDTPDLVHGPGQGPILWPELRCGEQYLIAIDTPLGSDYENIDLALELVRRFG